MPNNFERYTAALRNLIQLFVIKNGIKPKYLDSLRKIYQAEALFSRDAEIPTDICNFLSHLLTAVYIKKSESGIPFYFNIRINGNFLLSPKIYTALILSICRNAESIEIYRQNGSIIIRAASENIKHSLKLIKKLKGCVYFERITNTALIVLPITATDKKTELCKPNVLEEYLFNPFSAVNIYLLLGLIIDFSKNFFDSY